MREISFAALKARVDRLTFKRKYSEDALVHASKWFLADESLQSLNPESDSRKANDRFVETARFRSRSKFSGSRYSGP